MSIEVDITDSGTIVGVEETTEVIKAELTAYIAEELQATWEKIRDLAIDLCPKESGALASSIIMESEYGGRTAIQVSGNAGGEGGEFYSNSIMAGSPFISNFRGEPTDLYALFVHDGHSMPDGSFYEGVAYLADAIDNYQEELDTAVDRAMTEMGVNSEEM